MTTRNRTQQPGPTHRRQAGRQQRERRRQIWVLAFAAVIILVVLAIPAYGYYATFVAPPRHTVFSVNGVERSLGEVAKLAKANVAAIVNRGGQPNLSTLPIDITLNLLNEELVNQGAPRLGIEVSREEVDAEVRSRHYPKPKVGEQTDSEALEREFRETYRQYLDFTKFSEDQYRELVRRSVLRGKVQAYLSDQVPQRTEQVYAHWIHVRDDTLTEEIAGRLEQGEAFDRLARIYNIGDPYADDNGEVGWVPRGAFRELDSTLFSIEHDMVSEPLLILPNAYFIKVTAGPEDQPISEKMRTLLQTRVLEEWLEVERDNNLIEFSFGSEEYQWVIDQVRGLIPPSTS